MARTALSIQTVVDTGLEAAYTAANVDGHSLEGTGDVFIHVVNGDAADKTVTIVTGGTFEGKAVVDTTVVVTAGESRFIGPFKPRLYNQPDTGLVNVNFSAVTSVTVAAFRA